jgi:hypothetical protein
MIGRRMLGWNRDRLCTHLTALRRVAASLLIYCTEARADVKRGARAKRACEQAPGEPRRGPHIRSAAAPPYLTTSAGHRLRDAVLVDACPLQIDTGDPCHTHLRTTTMRQTSGAFGTLPEEITSSPSDSLPGMMRSLRRALSLSAKNP